MTLSASPGKCIGSFLRQLQVYKSTANVTAGKEMYSKYSAVDDEWTKIRAAVIAQKKPRQMFVQPLTALDEAQGATLTTFDASVEGMISSFAARFPDSATAVLEQWSSEAEFHSE